jgi:hypothetical protein
MTVVDQTTLTANSITAKVIRSRSRSWRLGVVTERTCEGQPGSIICDSAWVEVTPLTHGATDQIGLTMTDLSIAIQHTPKRADRRNWVRAMVAQLHNENPDVPVAVIEDTHQEGCWPTYRRALAAACGTSHHLVLQDDLGLCRDFIGSVREIIGARPASLITLYTNSRSVFTARRRSETWVENATVAGQAVIWPNELIDEFIKWQSVHIASDFPWDDVRVSMWLIKTSKRAFATVPSLTQHLGCGLSTLGLNGRSKVAAWYIGDNKSALGIDWSRGLDSPQKDTTNVRPEWWQHFHE